MTVPPAVDEAAEDDGYVCGPCQRNRHRYCRSLECACCEGGDDG